MTEVQRRDGVAEVAIVGLGVIGGSAALRLQQRGTRLTTYAASDRDRALARDAGIPVAASIEDAVRGAGLVLIAVPLDAIPVVGDTVVRAATSAATVLHAASLQAAESIRAAPHVTARVIGAHPLAGSHRSGFSAASADLYSGATVFIERRANARQRDDAELFWSLAGAARIEYATADVHDRSMAWASHLPQLASTALAATLAEGLAVESLKELVPYGGPGARDATRLAMSALDVWHPILDRAPPATLEALRALETRLGALRSQLERREWSTVEQMWIQARDWRRGAESGDRE